MWFLRNSVTGKDVCAAPDFSRIQRPTDLKEVVGVCRNENLYQTAQPWNDLKYTETPFIRKQTSQAYLWPINVKSGPMLPTFTPTAQIGIAGFCYSWRYSTLLKISVPQILSSYDENILIKGFIEYLTRTLVGCGWLKADNQMSVIRCSSIRDSGIQICLKILYITFCFWAHSF